MTRGVIYNHNMFIVQATELFGQQKADTFCLHFDKITVLVKQPSLARIIIFKIWFKFLWS